MLNPGRERLPPPSSFRSTLVTYPRWVPQFDSSPDRGLLNGPTLPTGTHSVRTSGATVTSPPGAPRPIPFVPGARSLNHTQAMHPCPNPTCPCNGNVEALPGCCSSSPPRCVNCAGDHTATNRHCESRPSPPPVRCSTVAAEVVPPPLFGNEMNTATDDRDVSPPS